MKKLVRILSLVMLVAMLMSIMSTGAFALVDGDSSGTNSGVTIGASQRPSNDSAYTGVTNEDGDDTSTTTVSPTGKGSAARTAAEKAAATYNGKQDSYDGLTDSDLDMVKDEDNTAFLKYIRDYVNDNPTLSDEMTAVVESAVTIFGEEAIYGTDEATTETAEVTESSEADKAALYDELNAAYDQIDTLNAQLTEANNTFADYESRLAEDETLAQDETFMAEYNAAIENYNSVNAQLETAQANADALADEYAAKYSDETSLMSIIPSEDIATKVSSKWKEVCPGSAYNSLAQAVQNRETMYFAKTMDIINSTDYNITLNLNLSTIYAPDGENAFYIKGCDNEDHDATISFTRGTIYGDGFYVVEGVLNLGGLINAITYPDITIYAETANAVTVNGPDAWVVAAEGSTLYGITSDSVPSGQYSGTIALLEGNVYINGGKVYATSVNSPAIANYGGNLIIEGSSYVDSENNVGLYLAGSGATSIEDGSVRGVTGIAITDTHILDISGGHVIGDLGSYTGILPGGTVPSDWERCGNAIAILNESQEKGSNPAVSVYAENVLLSENNLAIMSFDATGTSRLTKDEVADWTNVSLIDENCIEQEYIGKTGDWSDYNKAVVTITVDDYTTGYPSLKAAFEAAAAYTGSDDVLTIKLLADYTETADDAATAITAAASGATIVFDGNYHKLTAYEDSNGLTVDSGSVVIENVTIKDTHDQKMAGIEVDGGSVEIGDNVTINHFFYGLHVEGGSVLVNDMSVDDASECGIYCAGGDTTVVMCKVNCDTPVYATSTEYLQINGGWFLYQESDVDEFDGITTTGNAAFKVATYIDSKISNIQYVKADKYYEVLLNDTPVVQVVSGTTGYDTDGTPYVVYDKGDMEKLIFSVSPEVMTIEAVNAYTGVNKPIFNAPAGKSGNVAVQDSAMKDLPAGKYDLRFTFKTSNYVIKNKLTLYVYPAISILLNQDLTYNSDSDIVTSYDVGNMKNIAVYMSELPEKIAIGSDSTGVNVTYLENYVKDNPETWQLNTIKSTSTNRISSIGSNYTYIISYADLNNLATGQNYVFLRYGDDAYCAVERLPLTVYNASVYITPTAATWSGISSTLNFTVSPNVVEIYVDDDYVDPGYYTYDTTTGALSIKGSYFAALENGDHLLEIITSNGKVSATVHTGPAIAPKTVDYHVYGGSSSLSFVASDKIDYDLGITIGSSNSVNVDSFIIKDSDTQFTLSANYLNRLALGTYTISAYVRTTDDSGNEVYQKCSTTFRIISASQAAYNPGTGDSFNPVLWIAILVLAAIVIVVIILPMLRKSKKAAAAAGEVVETAEKIAEETKKKK